VFYMAVNDIRRTRTCERRKAAVPLDQVKIYPKKPDVNMILCEACCEIVKNAAKNNSNMPRGFSSKIQIKPSAASEPRPKPAAKTEDSDYETYICTRCNYRFRIDKYKIGSQTLLRCPYCGKPDNLKKG
jgi:DNA-directed RNA polymerase subunit RPC12/RpoP